jgi:hypothetical protein
MSFQAYLDNIKAKTGKTPADFAKLATARGLTAHGEIVAWLKADFALGHGHANAIAVALRRGTPASESRAKTDPLDALFRGTKAAWRAPADALFKKLAAFGPDVVIKANETYVNLLRGTKKFGIVQPASADRLDVGIKRKGVAAEGRFEDAGSWNRMVTHRVRIASAKALDAELVRWLRAAYNAL